MNIVAGNGVRQIELVVCNAGGRFAQTLANEVGFPVSANVNRVTLFGNGAVTGLPQASINGVVQAPGVGWGFYMPMSPIRAAVFKFTGL